jgi:hypothetical protein
MFIDDLLWYFHQTHNTHMVEGLTMALRFQIDNVARYLQEDLVNPQHEERSDKPLHQIIPNIAPLAPAAWFEYDGVAVGKKSRRYGCLIAIDYDRDELHDDDRKRYKDIPLPPDTRWVLSAGYWIDRVDIGDIVSGNWVYFIAISEDGRFLDMPSILWQGNPHRNREEEYKKKLAELQEKEAPIIIKEIIISLLAICFSHCKNVLIQEHQPSRQVRRAAERKGEPAYSFHTIDIQPATRVLREEGEVTKNGLAKALHICRGHFAHYTTEKPLFGKYTGTFYRPMHVRGSAEQGIVGKDYRVHP